MPTQPRPALPSARTSTIQGFLEATAADTTAGSLASAAQRALSKSPLAPPDSAPRPVPSLESVRRQLAARVELSYNGSGATEEEWHALSGLFQRALAQGLTDPPAVRVMLDNIRSGRFPPSHYQSMWSSRLNAQEAARHMSAWRQERGPRAAFGRVASSLERPPALSRANATQELPLEDVRLELVGVSSAEPLATPRAAADMAAAEELDYAINFGLGTVEWEIQHGGRHPEG